MAKVNYHFKSTQRNASIISFLSVLLFVIYSFVLFICYQSDIVALSHFIESDFVSPSPEAISEKAWAGALLTTLLCLIPALLLLRCIHFPLRLKALALFPSYIILGLITGIAPHSVDSFESEIPIISTTLFSIVTFVAIVLSQLYHEDRGEHFPIANYLAPNIFISCLGILFAMSVTNGDRKLHLQLELSKQMLFGNYEAGIKLLSGETTSSNNIIALQVFALSKQGEMPERMFQIEHLAGSTSLIPDSTPSSLIYQSPELVYAHLGVVPINYKGDATLFLKKALEIKRGRMKLEDGVYKYCHHVKPLIDYYLCALLLERNLSQFIQDLPQYYYLDQSLPRHYREAMVLHDYLHHETKRQYCDDVADSLFCDFQTLYYKHADNASVQRKECVNSFRGSYWNYYYFK